MPHHLSQVAPCRIKQHPDHLLHKGSDQVSCRSQNPACLVCCICLILLKPPPQNFSPPLSVALAVTTSTSSAVVPRAVKMVVKCLKTHATVQVLQHKAQVDLCKHANQHQCPISGGGRRGYLGQAQAAAWALPDGDDLLGLTAHTPGQPLQPPATPVQDGRLDRAAADTANIQSPARSSNACNLPVTKPFSPPRTCHTGCEACSHKRLVYLTCHGLAFQCYACVMTQTEMHGV